MRVPRLAVWPLPPAAWAVAAAAAGLAVAVLPPAPLAAGAAGLSLAALTLWEPALGVGAALVLGPSRAFLAASGYAGPQFDLGQIFFALAAASWAAHGLARRRLILPRLPIYLPLAAWIAVGLVSLFGAAEWRDGLNESLKWLEVAVLAAIVWDAAGRGRLPWVITAVLLAGVLQAGLGFWQYGLRDAGPDSFRLPDGHYRAYGTFEQPNPFGGFLGLIWPVAAGLALSLAQAALPKATSGAGRWEWKTWIGPAALAAAAGLLLLGLYVSFSRGAWLGAAAAAAALAAVWPQRRGLGLGLLAAGLIGGGLLAAAGLLPAGLTSRLAGVLDFTTVSDVRGLNITDANFALVERLAHWQAAQSMAEAHPWLGVGLGNYTAAYPRYRLPNWPNALGHAHNIYLHTLAETGVLGLAAYLGVWAGALWLTVRGLGGARGWRRGLLAGLLGVWVHLLAHQIVDNLHVNNNDLLLGAYLGILCAVSGSRGMPGDPTSNLRPAPAR